MPHINTIWCTILLLVRKTSNLRRRWHQMPPSRGSIQSDTLLGTWLSSRSSSSRTNMNNTLSGICDLQPVDCIKPSSTQTRTTPITWSGSEMHISSTKRKMGASYQGESNNMEWIYPIHCMSLILTRCSVTRRRRRKQQKKILSALPFKSKIQTNPVFLT